MGLTDAAIVAFCLLRLALFWLVFAAVGVIALVRLYPKLAAAIALTLALVGWHFQDTISDWWDHRKIARLEREVGELRQSQADLTEQVRQARVAAQAAQAAATAFTERTGATRQRMRTDHEANARSAAAGDLPAIVQRARDAAERARAAECGLSGTCPDRPGADAAR